MMLTRTNHREDINIHLTMGKVYEIKSKDEYALTVHTASNKRASGGGGFVFHMFSKSRKTNQHFKKKTKISKKKRIVSQGWLPKPFEYAFLGKKTI